MRAFALVVLSWLASCVAPVGAFAAAPTGGAAFQTEPVPAPVPAPMPAPPTPGAVPQPVVPGEAAVLLPDGTAAAPAAGPPQVQQAIWAANTIQGHPYRYGGGHASMIDQGYDCSGTVSFALNAAGLLKRARDSSGFMRYGISGSGRWITIYANPGHAYMVIAGLRLDTSSAGAGGGKGPRWRATGRPTAGYKVRHPQRL
ncbi:MAG TPA: hypothetical protein VES79_09850 [Solirubrobacteraceae bacterium]|nr:hypothetical protein [Solirubrobacteraceae bacterium]